MIQFHEHKDGSSTIMVSNGSGGFYCPRCNPKPRAPEASEYSIEIAKKYNRVVRAVRETLGSDKYGVVAPRSFLSKAHIELWEEMRESGLLSKIPVRKKSPGVVIDDPEAAAFTFNMSTGELDWPGKSKSLDGDL